MERIPKKVNFKVPEIEVKTVNYSRWSPLICAGAAAGVSIIALKEIKNVQQELVSLKKRDSSPATDELNKRMQSMEEQLTILTNFIQKKKVKEPSFSDELDRPSSPPPKEIIRGAVNTQAPIRIINNEEYEEIEVTDDEADEAEIQEQE